GNTNRRRTIARYQHVHLRIADLQIAAHIDEWRQRSHFLLKLLRRFEQVLGIGTLQRELKEGFALQATDPDGRVVAHVHRDSRHAREFWPQRLHHLLHLWTLRAGLQSYVQLALIGAPHVTANLRHHVRDGRILSNDLSHLFLMFDHAVERDTFHGFGGRIELLDILARQKTFRHDHVEVDSRDEQEQRDNHRLGLMPEHNFQTPVVNGSQAIPHLFDGVEHAAVPLVAVG